MKDLLQKLQTQGITNKKTLTALSQVDRKQFVDQEYQTMAYANEALPIACDQTISQPFVVALMTQILLESGPIENILEIGTGSGYQAAILAEIFPKVYSVERIEKLYQTAKKRLQHYDNVHLHHGDGFAGWEKHAPFDAIIVTAATPEVPKALLKQLKDSGRLLIPIGEAQHTQQLCLVTRNRNEYEEAWLEHVIFVPMVHGLNQES